MKDDKERIANAVRGLEVISEASERARRFVTGGVPMVGPNIAPAYINTLLGYLNVIDKAVKNSMEDICELT